MTFTSKFKQTTPPSLYLFVSLKNWNNKLQYTLIKCYYFLFTSFLILSPRIRVFWLNIDKSEIYLRYRYCSNLFNEMRKESEFWQNFEFRQWCYRNSCSPNSLSCVLEVWVLQKKNQLRQCHCRNREKKLVIVALPLPKMGGKKKLEWNCDNGIAEIGEIFFWQLWQCHCRKWEEKRKIVVAEIWRGI